MEEHFLKLSPANQNSSVDFLRISNEQFKGVRVLEYAMNHTNNSDSFKRARKELELVEVHARYLIVRITSEVPLQMVSKSLSGFSRELIRIDDIREAEEKKTRLFEDCVYNHSLFKSQIIEHPEELTEKISPTELSSATALKMLIDLFYGDTTKTKVQQKVRQKAIAEVKQTLVAYKNEMEL